jgi:hypothetical protein
VGAPLGALTTWEPVSVFFSAAPCGLIAFTVPLMWFRLSARMVTRMVT